MIAVSYSCGRILQDVEHVDIFLKNALHLDTLCDDTTYNECLRKVTAAAMLNKGVDGKDTLNDKGFRFPPFVGDSERRRLREKIYKELIQKSRPEQDDDITLGLGGALPRTEVKKERNAFYVIGLPASGKSEVSNLLSDQFGAIILDSDFAKRKFPEYVAEYGASVVHAESSVVTFGGKEEFAAEPSVLQYAVENGCNIVVPKIGNDKTAVLQFAKGLSDVGYTVHLVLVRLDREKATQRALFRYHSTKRYVPLQLIFDVYGNDPTIVFYDLVLLDEKNVFSSYTMLSSDVPKGEHKKMLYISEDSPITKEMLIMR